MTHNSLIGTVSILALSAISLYGDGQAASAVARSTSDARSNASANWSAEVVSNLIYQLVPVNARFFYPHEAIPAVLSNVIETNIPVPTNDTTFVAMLFNLKYSTWQDMVSALTIVSHITNESLADILLVAYTNYYGESYKLEGWRDEMDRSHFASRALIAIGTPELFDRFNTMMRSATGKPYQPMRLTISPDKYPEESWNWLLTYPDPEVRETMAGKWLGSQRPETPGVVREYLSQIEKLPATDSFWQNMAGRNFSARWVRDTELSNLVRQVDLYERSYRRWIEDGKARDLHSGSYDDEYWPAYKKERKVEKARQEAMLRHPCAVTNYVSLVGAHVAPFTNWATAATNIRAAIDVAIDGDTVLVADGIHMVTEEIQITNAVIIRSLHGRATTIIDGGMSSGSNRSFSVKSPDAAIEGFTISNAFIWQTLQSGDGMLCGYGDRLEGKFTSSEPNTPSLTFYSDGSVLWDKEQLRYDRNGSLVRVADRKGAMWATFAYTNGVLTPTETSRCQASFCSEQRAAQMEMERVSSARSEQTNAAKALGVPVEITLPRSGISLRFIPTGSYTKGSVEMQYEGCPYEMLLSSEKINCPFYIGKYEITQGQWKKVTGANPSAFQNAGDDAPVESVSWYTSRFFVKELAKYEGMSAFRLPEEIEWEYACRAMTTTRYSIGDKESDLARAAYYSANSQQTTHPVGQKEPNIWGLYDMHGSVAEWCGDTIFDRRFGHDPRTTFFVARGGSWNSDASDCRYACRLLNSHYYTNSSIGLRIVISVDRVKQHLASLTNAAPKLSK